MCREIQVRTPFPVGILVRGLITPGNHVFLGVTPPEKPIYLCSVIYIGGLFIHYDYYLEDHPMTGISGYITHGDCK